MHSLLPRVRLCLSATDIALLAFAAGLLQGCAHLALHRPGLIVDLIDALTARGILGAALAYQSVLSATGVPDSLIKLATEKLNALGAAPPGAGEGTSR